MIQPIEVTEVRPNVYMIVHGERRWRAAKMAGLETIPAVVRRRDYDQLTRFVRQIVENIQREDLNDVDRAAGMIRLRDLLQEELDRAQRGEHPIRQAVGQQSHLGQGRRTAGLFAPAHPPADQAAGPAGRDQRSGARRHAHRTGHARLPGFTAVAAARPAPRAHGRRHQRQRDCARLPACSKNCPI